MQALALLDDMTAAGVVPDEYTYASLITACGNSGQPEKAVQLLRDMTTNTNNNDDNSGTVRTAGLFSYNAAIGACDKVCLLLCCKVLIFVNICGLKPCFPKVCKQHCSEIVFCRTTVCC
jgi:pentatricopeptide repeat protein